MKIKILKNRFLYLLILLGLTLTFNGCSNDDNGEPKIQTFLEKYDGTKWITNTDYGELIYKFNYDINNPYDVWVQEEIGSDCHIFRNTKESWGVEFEITKNSDNEFTIQSSSNNYTDKFIFSIQGETLNMIYRFIEQGEGEIIWNLNFDKTSRNLNDIPVCEL